MKSMLLIGSLIAIASTSVSCSMINGGKHVVDTGAELETRRVAISEQVTELHVSSGISVVYEAGVDSMFAEIISPTDVIDYVEVKVSGDELTIRRNSLINSGSLPRTMVKVYSPNINDIDVSSGSAVIVSGTFTPKGGKTEIECSSGATLNVNFVRAMKVEASCSSGGSLNIAGECERATLEASSGASLNASSLKASGGKISASSGGSILSNIKNADVSTSSGGIVNNH